jgi:Ca2+-binding EF-hand superfamily protein
VDEMIKEADTNGDGKVDYTGTVAQYLIYWMSWKELINK